ncbi:tetratricopeptide repeat protein [Flavobacterium sp. RHBU_24]|uniref:tetratricopeptide repeat protein n=1 Tax=Flavobacterium sp. RHBU_24 TaxID=3391185 RepID=UPI0039853C29
MKIITLLVLFISATVFAQNDMKARIEYEDAETAFTTGDYEKAVAHLRDAEKLLGKWTPKVSYLLILSLDKTIDYENADARKLLDDEVKKYMQFAAEAKDLDEDKFREINTIEKYVTATGKWDGDEDYELAGKFREKNEYDKAYSHYKKSAAKGNLWSVTFLGWCYEDGKGVEKNQVEAKKYYKIAAERKITVAMNNLGTLYYETQKYPEAKYWLEKAAAKGNNQAKCALGTMYFAGLGVTKDYGKALSWYEKLDKDFTVYPFHMRVMGILYYYKKDKPDYGQAMKYLTAAYENGDANDKTEAKYFISTMYEEGLGVEKSKKLAKEWLKKE